MISIIIPTYNRAEIIPITLSSILSQEYQNWESIIVDDYSTDNTENVVKQFVAKDSRFCYLKNKHKKGAQGARNTGLYHSKSEWVMFFDSDNIMHPDFLEKLAASISNDVDVIQSFSNIIDVETKKKKGIFNWRSYGNIHDQLFSQQTYVDFNQAIIRRNKLLEIGGLDEDCPSMQEWDTHIRLSKIAKYATIEEPLLDYFVGGKDAISTDTRREVKGRLYILEKHIAEWENHKKAYKKFAFQIIRYIEKNSNSQFKAEAYKQLKRLAPQLNLMIPIEKIKIRLRSIYYKLGLCK